MNFIFKLFGWFFSNLFLILVVIAACYAYVYWDDPFGDDTPAGKTMAMFSDEITVAKDYLADAGIIVDDGDSEARSEDSASQQQIASVDSTDTGDAEAGGAETSNSTSADSHTDDSYAAGAEASVASSAGSRTESEHADTQAQLAHETASTTSSAASTVSTASEVAGSDAASDSTVTGSTGAGLTENRVAGSSGESEQANTETGEATQPEDSYVTPEIEQALSQLHNDGSMDDVQLMQKVDKPAEQLIMDARAAFYKRDYDTCIRSYKKLITQEKDNFNALGELGNVYFTQGKMEAAADAYYQAALIMVAQGHNQRAASLIGFLASVDAEKAKKLGAMLVTDDQEQGAL